MPSNASGRRTLTHNRTAHPGTICAAVLGTRGARPRHHPSAPQRGRDARTHNGRREPRWAIRARALDVFVEFPAIKPDTTTLEAIVDFEALGLGHVRVDLTGGTRHRCMLSTEALGRGPDHIGPPGSSRHGCPVVVRWSRPGSCATVTPVRRTEQGDGAA
jgi:hypothetical protein